MLGLSFCLNSPLMVLELLLLLLLSKLKGATLMSPLFFDP